MRIRKIEIETADIEGTARFYTILLGSDAVKNHAGSLLIHAGTSEIIFSPSKQRTQPVYHFAFNIPCNQIQEATAFVAEKTRILPLEDGTETADFSAWNAAAFYFNDNNGNVLEFIARRDLNNGSNAAFSPDSVLCVSEIGIVTDDVHKTVGDIRMSTGETPYEKQPVLDNFAAVGDANGLLILSSVSRHWYPTGTPAERFPLMITGEGKQGVFHLNFS